METRNQAPKLDRDNLVAEHDALNDMYVADKAADAITPDDQATYVELVNKNREGFKQLVVDSKNSGPIEIPVVKRELGSKATRQAIDPTYAQAAFEDNWGVNNH